MLTGESFPLPPPPQSMAGRSVAVWEEALTLPTFEPLAPERYPVFLDRRVYQGSSGRVYPLPFHHQIAGEPVPHVWRAVHLRNEWMHVVVLPELGGRLHVARDLTSGQDIFYTNPVIKPALVGLAGPWIAGGIELNWPQHHRPATYLATDVHLETESDGAVVVWCSDHDPFTRMKGMHGFRLRPDSAAIELEVRLYNRTEVTQSFLWWANVAARVDDDYQSFFPHDVTHVADHARRAITAFPRADRPYYGIDYPDRANEVGFAAGDIEVTGDRIDWYRNIPVPTSYMALGSQEDFFGGYDHASGLGFVHVADHHIAVGKKQWTWGNAPFGHAWDANLAEDGAHYVELMAGVFTDNQPDFSYLAPGETKVFTQRWFPIREIGPVDRATAEAAVVVGRIDGGVQVGVVVSATSPETRIVVTTSAGQTLATEIVDLDPGHPYRRRFALPDGAAQVSVSVTRAGRTLVEWTELGAAGAGVEPEQATEPPSPQEIDSIDELALVATHLELYRHATRSPLPYWEEALRRDPGHADALIGVAHRRYLAGDFEGAESLLSRAIARLTARHANPRDTRALYLHGLVLEALGDDEAAYGRYGRASWMRLWRAPAGYRMARIDARAGRHAVALDRLADVLRCEPEHLQALALTIVCHRRLSESASRSDAVAHAAAAAATGERARALDPLDAWLLALDGACPSADAHVCLDVAIDAVAVGEFDLAMRALDWASEREPGRSTGQVAAAPLIGYHRADVLVRMGRDDEAHRERERAKALDPTWCHPSRLADAAVLHIAADADATDAPARALLGTWSYAVGQHDQAEALWRASAAIDPGNPVVLRNLGLAAANDHGDIPGAIGRYDAAIAIAPHDARLLYERDQLAALAADAPAQRIARLDAALGLIRDRDDLTLEYLHLLITVGRSSEALEVLQSHRFGPWEGGEGQTLSAWDRAHSRLAMSALAEDDPDAAAAHIRAALAPPPNLGEGRHPLASTASLYLLLGDAEAAIGEQEAAVAAWKTAAHQRGDFLDMATAAHSETTFWTIRAMDRLGADANELRRGLVQFRDELTAQEPTVDYFATSLPDLLLFAGDPITTRNRRVAILDAQLALLDGDRESAATIVASPALRADRHAADLRHFLETSTHLLPTTTR